VRISCKVSLALAETLNKAAKEKVSKDLITVLVLCSANLLFFFFPATAQIDTRLCWAIISVRNNTEGTVPIVCFWTLRVVGVQVVAAHAGLEDVFLEIERYRQTLVGVWGAHV